MKSFGLWAVAKCLWFADKLALSRFPPTPFPTGLTTAVVGLALFPVPWPEILFRGAVVMAPCLTEWGFRSRTSWTHWLGKKPFWPRKMPSSIPLALSSPLVTEKKDRFEHFFPFPMKKRATSTGVEIVPQDLTFGPEKSSFSDSRQKIKSKTRRTKKWVRRVITLAFLISFCHNVHTSVNATCKVSSPLLPRFLNESALQRMQRESRIAAHFGDNTRGKHLLQCKSRSRDNFCNFWL